MEESVFLESSNTYRCVFIFRRGTVGSNIITGVNIEASKFIMWLNKL